MKINIDYTILKAKEDRTIEEHTNDVLTVYDYLFEKFKQQIVKIPDIFQDDYQTMREFPYYHDLGKANKYFQDFIEGNREITKIERQHAFYSFLIWANHQIEDNKSFKAEQWLLSYAIIVGHHNGLKEFLKEFKQDSFSTKVSLFDKRVEGVSYDVKEDIYDLLNENDFNAKLKNPNLMEYAKVSFSLLVVSDSLASKNYDFEETRALLDSLFDESIQQSDFLNKVINHDYYQKALKVNENESFGNQTSLNELRTLMNAKAMKSADTEKDIYIIEAPVGIGKTASSLSLAANLIEKYKMKKLIAVFPLNSVQEQYVYTLTKEYDIQKEYISVINSTSTFGIESNKEEEDHDETINFEQWFLYKTYLSNPIIITSHVKFFNTLLSFDRSDAHAFLNLKDAVVIIDEFQNFKKDYWFSIWGELIAISKIFGTKWIFTTGTLPTPKSEITTAFNEHVHFVLNEEERLQLFNSSYVKERCKFELMNGGNFYDNCDAFIQDLIEDIKITKERQILICLTQVKHTEDTYYALKETFREYNVLFLSGRHNSKYKQEIIQLVKDNNKKALPDKLILVTTKTVECGMDFDFDMGYKEFDKFDSAEQLAGRINRSNKKEPFRPVKLFKIPVSKFLHDSFYWAGLDNNEVFQRLKEKEFDNIYSEMYKNHQKTLLESKELIEESKRTFSVRKYRDFYELIPLNDYFSEHRFTTKETEQEFLKILTRYHSKIKEKNISFEVRAALSVQLNNELEPFTIKLSNKWYEEYQDDKNVSKEEYLGVPYLLFINPERLLNKNEVNGVISYLEKREVYEEDTYEQY